MKLSTAYLCVNCENIQDRAPRGLCDYCGGETLIPLQTILDGPTVQPWSRPAANRQTMRRPIVRRPLVERL